MDPKTEGFFFRWFSFSKGSFFGSMLILRGCTNLTLSLLMRPWFGCRFFFTKMGTTGWKKPMIQVVCFDPKTKRLVLVRYGYFQKWWYPQIIHFDRVFHCFYHPFWGFSPYFWKHPYQKTCDISANSSPRTSLMFQSWRRKTKASEICCIIGPFEQFPNKHEQPTCFLLLLAAGLAWPLRLCFCRFSKRSVLGYCRKIEHQNTGYPSSWLRSERTTTWLKDRHLWCFAIEMQDIVLWQWPVVFVYWLCMFYRFREWDQSKEYSKHI